MRVALLSKVLVGFLVFVQQTSAKELPSYYTELKAYTIPSPDQKKAGSCLYMASTGAMEILVNKYHGRKYPAINGKFDLAELYALRGKLVGENKSWFEDPILTFNGGGMLSRDLRFNPLTFWDDVLPEDVPKVELPPVATKTLFVAKELTGQARFQFGQMDESHIDLVKKTLVKYRSPVVAIYRDAGSLNGEDTWNTWHAVVIIGYDDNGKEGWRVKNSCRNVTRSFKGLPPEDQEKLNLAMEKGGGCRSRGVFYVRDSEGGKTRAPIYVKRSYDWLKYLGNHLFVAYIPQE